MLLGWPLSSGGEPDLGNSHTHARHQKLLCRDEQVPSQLVHVSAQPKSHLRKTLHLHFESHRGLSDYLYVFADQSPFREIDAADFRRIPPLEWGQWPHTNY